MFTGIVTKLARVVSAERSGQSMRLSVELGDLAQQLQVGGSVAINGVCLTATAVSHDRATLDVGAESLRLSTLAALQAGGRVNVELPLRAGDPMGGHVVQGHVDGTAVVQRIEAGDGGKVFRCSAGADLLRQMVMKGSVAVDGVSLTISALHEEGFESFLIPHTLRATTLGERRIGDRVNVETDIIGKYVARYLGRPAGGITERMLEEYGFK